MSSPPKNSARATSPARAAPPPRTARPDFKTVESSRPPWDSTSSFRITQTALPSWKFGDGANDSGASLRIPHVEIDPYSAGRPALSNYKLLISGMVPRPLGFLSTRSADGAHANLAPFSYVQVVAHDPPTFVVSFVAGKKDSLRNLLETNECVINVVSEHFIEAANATAVDAPWGVSEWALSGLTPAPCSVVKASRVKEAVFSIEGRLESVKEIMSREKPGEVSATMAVIEGVRFWVREDAIDEEHAVIDPAVCLIHPSRVESGVGELTNAVLAGPEADEPDWRDYVCQGDGGGRDPEAVLAADGGR